MHVTYNLLDRPTRSERFDGSVVSNRFDSEGRLSQTVTAGQTNSFAHYRNGWLRSADNGFWSVTNRFDGMGRLTNAVSSAPWGAVNWAWDVAGNPTSRTSVAGRATWTFDAAERLSAQTTAAGVFEYEYATNGLVAGVTCTNLGLRVACGRDVLGRATNIVWTIAGTNTLRSFAYEFDAAGMITNVVRADGSRADFRYDEMDRLIRQRLWNATNGLTLDARYQYDRAGNRTNSVENGITNVWTLGVGNRLASWGTSGQAQHNPAGCVTNLVDGSRSLSLEWDGWYRLASVSTGGTEAAGYSYDALGRLARTIEGGVTNWLVYDGPHVIAEVDGIGALRRSYTWGPGVDNLLAFTDHTGTGTNTYYALTDHTIIGIVDAHQTVPGEGT
jgi:YD repeat-containing protein